MMPGLIASCFWTYSPTTSVPAGQALEFSVVVPPPVTGAVSFPVTGSAVSWVLAGANGQALVPGVDYLILAGDLLAERLAVVFKPPAQATSVTVVPQLTLFSAPSASETSAWTPQGYTLQPVSGAQVAQAQAQLAKTLALAAENTIIEPGNLALLHVATKNVLDVPQVVTSVLHETPHVRIRGAIPLDSIVQAFLSPVTNALGHFVPGSKSTVTEAGLEVQKLLGGLFSIPLAIDVLGDKLTKTLLPTGTPQIPLVSASPDGQSLEGTVPIGRWPARVSTARAATWVLTEGQNAPTVYNDVSPGVDLVKSFLLRPALVPLSTTPGAMSPTPITVSVTLHIALDVSTTPIDIQLPSVTLQRVPLPVPQIAAVFKHAFDDVDSAADQRAVLTTDAATAPFLASVGDCLNLITRTASVLNAVVAVATTLGTQWTDVLNLAGAFGALAERLGAIGTNPGSIAFRPCLPSPAGPCVTLTGSWNNAISAIIAIGPPSPNGFVLSDSDGPGWIAFGGSASYSSIIPSLNAAFSSVQQIPPGSATSNQPGTNFNDVLEVLCYGKG